MSGTFGVHVAHALDHLSKETKHILLLDALFYKIRQSSIRTELYRNVDAVLFLQELVESHDGRVLQRG